MSSGNARWRTQRHGTAESEARAIGGLRDAKGAGGRVQEAAESARFFYTIGIYHMRKQLEACQELLSE